jgi:hypothetical protein
VKRGWRKLPFTEPDLRKLLEVASETVALLRLHLDSTTTGIKLRQVDGSAQEFLWGVDQNPGIYLDGQNYTYVHDTLRGVVHATLKDAHGYVEGVDQLLVERFVDAHPFTHELLIPTAAKQRAQ